MTMPYYNVPADVLEDRDTLARWAARAVAIAVRSKTTKPAKAPMAAKGRKTTS